MAREPTLALRRALAALAVSVGLHLALGVAVGSYLLGDLLVALARDPGALSLVFTLSDRAAEPPAASAPGDVALPRLPPAPLAAAEAPAPPESAAAAELAPPEAASAPALAAVPEGVVPAPVPEPELAARGEGAGTPEDDARPDETARRTAISASVAGEPFVGRREVFEFLLDHFDFATHVMGAIPSGRSRFARTDEGQFTGDGWAGALRVSLVQATSGTRVLHARGELRQKLLPVIAGEAMVTIMYDAEPTGDGRDRIQATVSSRLELDGAEGDPLVELVTAVVSGKAEKESRRLLRTFAQVLRHVEEQPEAIYAALLRRPEVDRGELEQFRLLLRLP